MARINHKTLLAQAYNLMFDHFGPRHWWPAETTFEIIVGAILTQSVSWRNVSKAIEDLRKAGLLDLKAMYVAPIESIEQEIVPTLYWRMKAKKLKAFVNHVMEKYAGSLENFLVKDMDELRTELLSLFGIGPETADSIILYAAQKPIFVVDAYTRRIFHRLGIFKEDVTYDDMQRYFMRHLPPDVQYYNEYHALIDGVGNNFCANKRPKCEQCPVHSLCKH